MDLISFLPGPVNFDKATLDTLSQIPISHRSDEYKNLYDNCTALLCKITGSPHTFLAMGSGTLANEMIAASLSTTHGKGVIITNGEFGERLTEQAERFSLNFTHFCYGWGAEFDYSEIIRHILEEKPAWLWMVHVETSTGIINDYTKFQEACLSVACKLCVDIMSSLGNMEVDLSKVYFAAASSGKGLSTIPGLALIFSSQVPPISKKIPKYLDLGYYHSKGGIPFTFSANIVSSLYREAGMLDIAKRQDTVKNIALKLRNYLTKRKIKLIGREHSMAEYIITAELPKDINSLDFGNYLKDNKVLIHYKNEYLKDKNWIQLTIMGYPKNDFADYFIELTEKYLSR